MSKSRHIFRNPNPSKSTKSGDCVIRAISIALDMDWDEVYKDLCTLGFQLKRMPNDAENYRTYLTNCSYRRTGISNRKGSKRPTVESFAKDHKQGTYILEVANHIVTVRDGHFYDTWDCSEKCLYGYWTISATT